MGYDVSKRNFDIILQQYREPEWGKESGCG